MSLLQFSLDDIPINLVLFRFTKNSFSCIHINNLALEEFKHYKEGFILLMIDTDYFKRINDNFGHDIGDYILKEVTAIISLHICEGDELARLGGEEFLLLPHL
ncbi:MAG: hypothetical protein SPLUMA2_SPLUMAMAG2_00243 [uncultured Sulfurimonas sp.]|nr:MAG: hypothetical protein SPLUMA1_SPLUMAMAG1_00764 [uncultured Sulfurimonas sp.]CAI6151899.1 MAG: hypothetical protein SPLUMA2_SPLUMAMAG2_00243 [uncultured Sulfurimonas sp.]